MLTTGEWGNPVISMCKNSQMGIWHERFENAFGFGYASAQGSIGHAVTRQKNMLRLCGRIKILYE